MLYKAEVEMSMFSVPRLYLGFGLTSRTLTPRVFGKFSIVLEIYFQRLKIKEKKEYIA